MAQYGGTTWNEIISYCGKSSFPVMEIREVSRWFHYNWEWIIKLILLKVAPSGFLKH